MCIYIYGQDLDSVLPVQVLDSVLTGIGIGIGPLKKYEYRYRPLFWYRCISKSVLRSSKLKYRIYKKLFSQKIRLDYFVLYFR